MTDRPILFSGPMIRALLAGTKTQTRRVLTPANTLFDGRPWTKLQKAQEWDWNKAFVDAGPSPAGNPGPYLHLPWLAGDRDPFEGTTHRIYPKIQPGDRIWVRETWAPLDRLAHGDPGTQALIDRGFYRADGGTIEVEITKWTPAIHMPRRASRLTLTITGVKIERLQDISDEDAIAEGIEFNPKLDPAGLCKWRHYGKDSAGIYPPSESYMTLWDSINGPGSSDADPWVVAYTFTVDKRNIDQIARAA